jgi:uncharacterized protein YndB with AHSA1/START domain
MEITRSVEISRTIDDVFAYVADPRNDPEWCAKVLSVAHTSDSGPGPTARYEVVHRPVPILSSRRMDYVCVGWKPPNRIDWREDDGTDVLNVTYMLDDLGQSTRMAQRSRAELAAPRMLHPLMRLGIGHDIARQLKTLKRILERGPSTKVRRSTR